MVVYVSGNLFDCGADILVNPVNCMVDSRGTAIMGAGVALQFRRRFPENYKQFSIICNRGWAEPGRIYGCGGDGVDIWNATTKGDWRNPSEIHWIDNILHEMVSRLTAIHNVSREHLTVAMPLLGCGHGMLEPRTVKRAIETTLEDLPNKIAVCSL